MKYHTEDLIRDYSGSFGGCGELSEEGGGDFRFCVGGISLAFSLRV